MGLTVAEVLGLTDLDELADAAAELPAEPSSQDAASVQAVLRAWSPVQAVANLLMYPQLIDPGSRGPNLSRGLTDEHPYLRLAAAVGVGQLWGKQRREVDRPGILAALLELIQRDGALTAERAALSVAAVLRPDDAAQVLAALARNPAPEVRRNLEAALLGVLDTDDIADLLDDADPLASAALTATARAAARDVLAADGIDLDRPADEQRRMPVLARLPNLAEWAG